MYLGISKWSEEGSRNTTIPQILQSAVLGKNVVIEFHVKQFGINLTLYCHLTLISMNVSNEELEPFQIAF